VPDGIPPDVIWASGGGGTGTAAGFVLDLAIGGNNALGVSAGPGTLFYGAFASETF
jgi:hypothetical protein